MPKTKLVAALFTGPARQISRNTRIFRAGEPARSLYFLASGLVKLTDISTSGDEIIVELYRSGEIFGELCFRGGVQESGATAVERSEIREIPAGLLIEQVRTRPDALMDCLENERCLPRRMASSGASLPDRTRFGGTKLWTLVAERDKQRLAGPPHDFRHEELAQMLSVRREQ